MNEDCHRSLMERGKCNSYHIYLDVRVRFELTVLRICNPLHWATLPPHDLSGVQGGTRTPTNGFEDRCAAITLPRQLSYQL